MIKQEMEGGSKNVNDFSEAQTGPACLEASKQFAKV